MKNKKTLKKFGILTIIVILVIGILILSDSWKDFISVILIALVGCFLPFLFDETDSILKLLNYLAESIKPEKYKSTIKLYNERLSNFSTSFYFFLVQILDKEQKSLLLDMDGKDSLSIELIIKKFKQLLEFETLNFVRIKDENGNVTFNDCSCGYFKNAEGELNDLFRILNILPPVLEFVSCRNEDFMNMQSVFYQTKNSLCYNANSSACEALTKCLISDIIKLLEK